MTAPGRTRSVDSSCRMSGFWVSSRGGALPSAAFLILVPRGRDRPEVGGRRGHHHGVGAGRGADDGVAELGGRLDPDHLDAGRVGQRDVGGHQGDLGAARGRRTRQGVALQAGRPVAQEADGVEVLAGAAGADHDRAAGQVGSGHAARQHLAAHLEDLERVGQPALAGVGAGEAALGRLDDQGAAAAQGGHVGGGGGVLPHLGVHGRGEHDRAPGGQEGVGEQVVGQPVRRLGQQVGRGGGDHDEVGGLADADVRDLVHVVPDLGRDGLAGQGGPGVGARRSAGLRPSGTTVTSWPDSVNRRSSSQAL